MAAISVKGSIETHTLAMYPGQSIIIARMEGLGPMANQLSLNNK